MLFYLALMPTVIDLKRSDGPIATFGGHAFDDFINFGGCERWLASAEGRLYGA